MSNSIKVTWKALLLTTGLGGMAACSTIDDDPSLAPTVELTYLGAYGEPKEEVPDDGEAPESRISGNQDLPGGEIPRTEEPAGGTILYTGYPIHLEAKIKAPGLIRKINLEMRQKSGYGNFWISKEFTTSYAGLKEIATFHDHPVVAEDFALGEYTFELKVTDQNGKVGTVEADVTVKAGDGQGGGHIHDERGS